MKFPKKVILLSVLCLLSTPLLSQEENPLDESESSDKDTLVYFEDFSHLLNLKLYTLIKSNSVTVRYDEEKLILEPNSPVSLGVGFNYKGLGLALGIGLPQSKKNKEKYGKTTRLDIQLNLNTRMIVGLGYFQMYRGYYNSNPGSFVEWNEPYYPVIKDMRTISMGLSAFYVFNHKRFSSKAAFTGTQIQKRSAGSLALGLYGNYDEAYSPEGFVPKEFADSIATDLDIKSFRYFATGVMFGYMYTWVFAKNFFLHLSGIPGFGYKNVQMDFVESDGGTEQKPDFQIYLRGAIGYESKHFYLGITASTLIRNIEYKDYDLAISTNSFRFFVGKRFNVSGKKSRKTSK